MQHPADIPDGAWPLWFVNYALQHNRRFGMLLVFLLDVDTVLIRIGADVRSTRAVGPRGRPREGPTSGPFSHLHRGVAAEGFEM